MAAVMQDDGPVMVEFFLSQAEDREASKKAGHYVGKDVEFIRITPPGGNLIWEGEITEKHRERYARQYQAWKDGLEPPEDGTPLKEWPPISPGHLATLSAMHIRTVEALANAPDNVLQRAGMGVMALRDKARTYLEAAANHGRVAELVDSLQVEINALRERNAELEEAIEKLKADRPRRGRPPKNRDAAA